MGISRQCAHKWWRCYQADGVAGLEDRSSRPQVHVGHELVGGIRGERVGRLAGEDMIRLGRAIVVFFGLAGS
jgi:hypothetical protein